MVRSYLPSIWGLMMHEDLECHICFRRIPRFRSHEMVCYRCRNQVCMHCLAGQKARTVIGNFNDTTTSHKRIICRNSEGGYN